MHQRRLSAAVMERSDIEDYAADRMQGECRAPQNIRKIRFGRLERRPAEEKP